MKLDGRPLRYAETKLFHRNRARGPALRPPTDAPPKLGRARRAIGAVAKTIGVATAFVAGAAIGVVVHLDVAAVKRAAANATNMALANSFQGRIEVERVGGLSLGGLAHVDASVFDPSGHRVIMVRDANVALSPAALLASLPSSRPIEIDLPKVRVGYVDVVVEQAPNGDVGVADAFNPKTPSPPSHGRGTKVSIPDIAARHVWVHGSLNAVPTLDADVDAIAAAVDVDPKATSIDLRHADVIGRALQGREPRGSIQASAVLPAAAGAATILGASYEGVVGRVPLDVSGSMNGKIVEAVVDVPRTDAASINALAPDALHLADAAGMHVEARGTLPELAIDGDVGVGAGRVSIDALVTVPDDTNPNASGDAHVTIDALDASAVQAGAPKTNVAARLDVHAAQTGPGKIGGTYSLDVDRSVAAGQVVPPIALRGKFTQASVDGTARIAETGAPSRLRFALEPNAKGSPTLLSFAVSSDVPDLARVARLNLPARGSAHVRASGRVDLSAKTIDAEASGDVEQLAANGVTLDAGTVVAKVGGTFERPVVHAGIGAEGVAASGYKFSSVRIDASGSQASLAIAAKLVGDGDENPNVSATATLGLSNGVRVGGAAISIERGGERADVRFASLSASGGSIAVNGLTIDGLGDRISAPALSMRGRNLRVDAQSKGIDLGKLAKLLAREEDIKGSVAFDVDVRSDRRRADGRIDLEAKRVSIDRDDLPKGEANVKLHADLAGSAVTANLDASYGDALKIAMKDTKIELAGAIDDARSWQRAKARGAMEGEVDLAKALALVPEAMRPVERAAGTVRVALNVARERVEHAPTIDLRASTRGLVIIGKSKPGASGAINEGPQPFRSEGVDATVFARVDGEGGGVKLAGSLFDRHGTVASLDASATLPLTALLRSGADAMKLAASAPFDVHLAVPRRSFEDLPEAVGKVPVEGAASLDLEAKGTIAKPDVALHVEGKDLRAASSPVTTPKIDVAIDAKYDGRTASLHASAFERGRRAFDSWTVANVAAEDILTKRGGAWVLGSNTSIAEFPIASFGTVVPPGVRGRVSGSISLGDLHRDASLSARLDFHDLVLDEARIERAFVRANVGRGAADVDARLEQSDGFFETKAKAVVDWGAQIVPSLDATKAFDASVLAKNFRADAAQPFLEGSVDELDGRIDANLVLHATPATKAGKADGAITIREGKFEASGTGEEIHDIKGQVVMRPWGTFRLEGFEARGVTGRVTAEASAKFAGIKLVTADAAIHIKDREKMPIVAGGVPLGAASGEVKIHAAPSPDGGFAATVDVPKLEMELPQSSGHDVQALDADNHVRIGVHEHTGKFDLIALAPTPAAQGNASSTPMHIDVDLGEIHVKRDTSLDVTVTGKPHIDVGATTKVSGEIRLERGKIDVNGKKFKIERGFVSFVGPDPSDPEVVAEASWDAPDGTHVVADFTGDVKRGKLALHSEPALTQDEIVNLILFGQPEGSFGASSPPGQQESTVAEGAGLAGGYIAQALNKALKGVSDKVTTNVDTSESDNPRPELSLQLSDRVSATIVYNLGVPPPGQNPDTTQLDLDFRLFRRWSLEAMVGDRGSTGMDLLWRKRY